MLKDKKHNIALLWTQYMLILYIMFFPDWKKSLLFIYRGRIGTTLIKRLHDRGAKFWGGYWLTYLCVVKKNNIFARIIGRLLNELIRPLLYVWIRLKGAKNIHACGYEHIFGAITCLEAGVSFSVLEEGIGVYDARDLVEKFFRELKSCYAMPDKYLPGGWSDAVEEVICTGRKAIPKGLENKTKIYNLREIWSNLDEERKHDLFYLFDVQPQKWMNIVNQGRDILFLTQNFSPFHMSEKKEIEMYCELMSAYDYKRILIKVHPADGKNYEKIFPECMVIKDELPIELMWMIGIPFKKIIGINSTALYGLWPENMVDDRTDLLQKYTRPELLDIGI